MDSLPSCSYSINCLNNKIYDILILHNKENHQYDVSIITNNITTSSMDLTDNDDNDDDYFNFDTSTLYFTYDMHDFITNSDNVTDIIEEYISWRAHIGRLGFIPKAIGKLYISMMQLDIEASNVFGNYTSLIKAYNLNDNVNAIYNLKSFIESLKYKFLDDKSLLLVGLFGYMAQYWSSKKMYSFIPKLFTLLLDCVSKESLNSIKYYE
ncbi:A52R-like family protein [Eptesipox virus]|uniref:A52R-like family protein n=1 Tax=Eptesipox virus TaxID=1329402 RepID=A0A220T6K5_9POXV|nr:A52R-like family protein [Eptesipox virus]ASK51351.1 A52R-like family protein [Eptesipox virus]WAH71109.1 A52R-like family protein [Eptesipox virus]